MKIERVKVKKCSSEVPGDCKTLIDKLKSCSEIELHNELKKIKIWNCGKCELYHWIDVLDLFDTILEESCFRSKKNQWVLPCDMPGFENKKMLLLQILHFTALLIEHSFSRHLYNSMEHLTTLLSSCDMQVVLGVLNLLYVFSKRSNFITRLSGTKRQAIISRLTYLAESWGGKENGFGLAQCCQDLPITSFPSSATTLHFEFYDEKLKQESKKQHSAKCIHIENVDKMSKSDGSECSAAEIMENLVENYAISDDKAMFLFTHLRLAHCFHNYHKRSHCVQARLQALSVLVYSNALQDNANSLLYNGLIEELVDVLELKDPNLIEIKAASLRTLTSIIHLERNPRLNAIIDATGASSYHGFLPVLVRSCIQALTNPQQDHFPLPFATALFSCLYHLASYEAGGEALVSCGMLESLLRVVNWPSTEPEHITFVTRAVRVIDLITNLDMAAFQTHSGLTAFINRLEMEVNVCRKEQPFVIRTRGRNSSSSSYSDTSNFSSQTALPAVTESSVSLMDVDPATTPEVTPSTSNSRTLDTFTKKLGCQCLPQRAALLKSLLNFLKKAFQDPTFSDSIRHVMDGPLPSALKHVISNAEYYGPSLFLLATDVVTVYVFQEPSLLSSLQDSGLTDVVLHALLVKDVPAAREVLASLPNVFSALCLNSRGLQAFVACKPFERLFKVLLSSDYLQAMRRRRSTDPMGDTANNLGNAVDELMRHQPSLKADATSAIIKLLEELCSLGTNPKYICTRPTTTTSIKIEITTRDGNSAGSSGQRNTSNSRNGNDAASSDDDEEEDEESSTTSSNMKNGAGDGSSGEDKNSPTEAVQSDSSKTPVPLVDYVLNVMKFVDAILSNNSTDDHCREFVAQKGLVPLMNILSLPNLPIDFPVTPACQAIAAVCKSILNLAHEPQVMKQGLTNLNNVLESLEALHQAPSVSCSTVLLSELASVAPNTISEATANAHTTPLLHAMSAAHAFIMMFVHVCRTGQSDIRTISINNWGSPLGLKVLTGLSKLYTALVWESTILLALCNGQPLPCNCEQHGKAHQLESLIPGLIEASVESNQNKPSGSDTPSNSVTSAMEALSTDSPSSAPMEVDELVETFNGETKNVKTKLTQSQQAQIKQIKPLLSGSSRLGRALAELFGLLVKLCVGIPLRQRRGQQILQTPPVPSRAARSVASSLTQLLAGGLSWEPPASFPSPYLRMTFFICSIGFTSPMLFDEKKFPYHLMLQKFLSSGGQNAFFEVFHRIPEIISEQEMEKQDVANGTGEFLDAWLMLLEKMSNPKTVLESPHTLAAKSSQPEYTPFSPVLYLIHTHKQAFEALMQLWERKPLKVYGARMSYSILTVLCHIIKGEAIIKEKLDKDRENNTESTSSTTTAATSNNSRRRRYTALDVNQEHLNQLMDMGFHLEQAMDALYHSTTIEQATDFLLSNPSPALSAMRTTSVDEEDKSKDATKDEESDKQSDEDPIDPDVLDQFTATRLIPGCMKLLDSLPDTVYRVCDLLVAVVHRNGPEWRDKMIFSLINEMKKKMNGLLVSEAWQQTDNASYETESNQFAVRVHLITLLFEELKWHCITLFESLQIVEGMIGLLYKASKIKDRTKDVATSKWLAPVLLLVDLYEKMAIACNRRAAMVKVTSHTWKWFDDRNVRWSVYNSSNNKTIDDAYRAGESTVNFTAGRRKYTILFSSMLQVSEETGNRRPVMLSLKSKDDKSNKEAKKENPEGAAAMETDSSSDKEESNKEEEIKLIPRLSHKFIYTLLDVCIAFIELPVDPDTLHAVMRLCLRFTRDHQCAVYFAEKGGIQLIINLTQASTFMGFTSLTTLLIRHIMEDSTALKLTMEKAIRSATMATSNTFGANKELHYLFRLLSPAICRDPQTFTEIAKSYLRVALPHASKRGEEDLEARFNCPNAVQFLKSLPGKSNPTVAAMSSAMEDVIISLLDALIVKINYDDENASTSTQSVPSTSEQTTQSSSAANGVFNTQARLTEAMPRLSFNNSNNELLQNDDDDISRLMDTSTDQSDTKKSEKKEPAQPDEESKKRKPLLHKSAICRILAELVRSYPACAKLVAEHTYRAKQTELVPEESSALSFILDYLLPQCENTGDKDCPSLARMLLAAIASANHCPEAQATLVTEVKHALGRSLLLSESITKHAKIQSLSGIIGTMIESCPPMHGSPNQHLLSSFKSPPATMNNIVKLLVKKGMVGDLAKIPHSIDLSSPCLAATINTALKPLEVLSKVINQPAGNIVNSKGVKSKTAPTSSSATPSIAPPPHTDSPSIISSQSQGNLNTRDESEEHSQPILTTATTESENTNTQDDITTEDATENDTLDLSMPGENSTAMANEDSCEELDEIIDQLLDSRRAPSSAEGVNERLVMYGDNADVQENSQDDERDDTQDILIMDSDMRMNDRQHDSVYEPANDDNIESSESSSDSDCSDDDQEGDNHDDDDDDGDDNDDDEGSNFEADDFADWEDNFFHVQDRADDFFIHLEDVFPASVRDRSFLLSDAADGNAQLRAFQVPLREENIPTEAAQAMPPAPGSVNTNHPLLTRNTDPHAAVSYRVYRGANAGSSRQRSYRLTPLNTSWQIYAGGRRHQNQPAVITGDELRFVPPDDDMYDLQEQPTGYSSAVSVVPSASLRWAEESRVLDGDSVHDCVTSIKPEIIELLEKYRDVEIGERKEKKRKQIEEEAKKSKDKDEGKKDEENEDAKTPTAASNAQNQSISYEYVADQSVTGDSVLNVVCSTPRTSPPINSSSVEMMALSGLATSIVEEVLSSSTSTASSQLPTTAATVSSTTVVSTQSVQQTPMNTHTITTPGAPRHPSRSSQSDQMVAPTPLSFRFPLFTPTPNAASDSPLAVPPYNMASADISNVPVSAPANENVTVNPLVSLEQTVEQSSRALEAEWNPHGANVVDSNIHATADTIGGSNVQGQANSFAVAATPPSSNPTADTSMLSSESNANTAASSGSTAKELEVPEGVDPSFLAALPENIRQEVIAEQLRLQRLRQPPQSAAPESTTTSTVTTQAPTAAAGPSADGNFSEVSPEFLAALPPNIQEEVLQQQRQEQQRLAAQNSNPEVPVDPAGFIQTLPPGLRQQVLADMDDSVVAVLPTELASEAQTLRREVEARQRQLHERFFNHNSSALSTILRSSIGRLSNRHGIHAVPQPHLAWAIQQSVGNSGRSSSAPYSSAKVRGRQLLDHEGLTCLLVLLFIDEPFLNTSRLHRVLRNLSFHSPSREWIIKSLLDIMCKTEACKLPWSSYPNSVVDWQQMDAIIKDKSSDSSKCDSQSSSSSSSSMNNSQPAWLSISLNAALGCRATVFQIHRPQADAASSKGKSSHHSSSSNHTISVHPQASPIICRHVLDTLIFLARGFPSHFLPSNMKDSDSKSNKSNKFVNKSAKSENSRTDFWDMLVKLDASFCASGSSAKGKGKSLVKPHCSSGLASSDKGSTSDEEKGESMSFELSPLGLLINTLSHPVIKRSSLLTDRLLRLLALVSLGFPDQQNSAKSTAGDSSTKALTQKADCDTDDVQDEDMEVEDEKRREKDSIEQHLKLAVEVLTSKSCSEEGLEDATALLLQLSRGGGTVTRQTVLKLLLEGASKLGEVVCTHIHKLMIELRNMNQTRPRTDKDGNEESAESDGSDAANKSLGLLQDRFTQAQVVITAPSKVKACRELQIPAMAALTSKTSSQAFFLRVLKVIIQLQQDAKLVKKSKRRSQSTPRTTRDSQQNQQPSSTAATVAESSQAGSEEQAQNEENASAAVASNSEMPMEVDGAAAASDPAQASEQDKREDELPRLSQQLVLEELWSTLSDCLMELAETPDHHAVLVLQPAVEAFFLVHASAAEKESSQRLAKQDTQENQMAHLHQDIAPLSPLPSSKDTSTPSRQNSTVTIPSNLPPDTQKFLRFAETHRTVLNQILRQSTTHLADGPFSVLVDHTRVLDFDVKRRYFRQELERMDEGIRREDLAVHIRREHVFEDSFRELHRRTAEEWKNRFYIVFEGEEGQDAGGLLREWYMIVSREIFNPMYALFTTSPGDRVTYMINSASHCNSNHLSYFKFVGRVIAKAVYDNKLLECYFTRSFYNHILAKPVKHTDMESEDYSFYQGLAFLLDHNVSELGYDLTFSTEVQEFGVTEVRDLKPDGRNIIVTEDNKQEYVRLVCQMKMTGAIRKQLNGFLEGFYDIIPKRLISIFNEQELELLISGLPVIDIDDLKSNTEYHKYQPNSLQIQWFWRALRSFDQADRAKFLQFVTGTSKVPLQGFSALEGMNGTQNFQIHRDDRSTDRLPSAHTCFNQLDLPAYETYDKLKERLLTAVHECSEGFGFA